LNFFPLHIQWPASPSSLSSKIRSGFAFFWGNFPKILLLERILYENVLSIMDAALNKALSQPDVDDILLSAADHADTAMRKYIWRGFRPKWKADRELMVGDKTAKDFVNEALRRLCDGRRTYNPQRSLIENLNSVTDSLISSEKKTSDRTGIVDFAEHPDKEEWTDPIASNPSPLGSADAVIMKTESCDAQRACFQLIKAAFDGDKATQDYLEALSEGFFDIQEISDLTGIPVPGIYEIRRKLKDFAPKFFGVTKYKELERKIEGGS
jgi:hypothetical protein